jgi:hypothetical protein
MPNICINKKIGNLDELENYEYFRNPTTRLNFEVEKPSGNRLSRHIKKP